MNLVKKIHLVIGAIATVFFIVAFVFATQLKKQIQTNENMDKLENEIQNSSVLFVTILIWCLSIIPIILYYISKQYILEEKILVQQKAYFVIFVVIAIIQTFLLNSTSLQNQIDTIIGLCIFTFVCHCFFLWYLSIEFVFQRKPFRANRNIIQNQNLYQEFNPNQQYNNTYEPSAPMLNIL